jgi:hypothetical protein
MCQTKISSNQKSCGYSNESKLLEAPKYLWYPFFEGEAQTHIYTLIRSISSRNLFWISVCNHSQKGMNLNHRFALFIQGKPHLLGPWFDSDRKNEIGCMYRYYICIIAKWLYHLLICIIAILQISNMISNVFGSVFFPKLSSNYVKIFTKLKSIFQKTY